MHTRVTQRRVCRAVAVACLLLMVVPPLAPRAAGRTLPSKGALPSSSAGGPTAARPDQVNGSQGIETPRAAPATPLASSPPYWLPVAPLHIGRFSLGATVGLDGRIYAIGGFSYLTAGYALTSVEAYSPTTNQWTAVAPLQTPRYDLGAGTSPEGRIFALAGADTQHDITSVEAYRPAHNRWVFAPDVGMTAGGSGTASYGARIYEMGGAQGIFAIADVWAYDMRTGQTATLPPLPTARTDLAAAAGLDGTLYALGGADMAESDDAKADAYNPRTQRWTRLPDMPTWRCSLAAAAGADGRIYAIGGADGCHEGTNLSSVDAYDPRTRRWTPVADLPEARLGPAAVRGTDGRLYVLGGLNGPGSPSDYPLMMEAYGPLTTVQPARASAGSTVVLTGTNFAAGATVSVTWGATPNGTVLGTGHTDSAGTLLHAITIVLPRTAPPGHCDVTAEDDRSRYPVTTGITVTQRAP